jgi:hypothetical protein
MRSIGEARVTRGLLALVLLVGLIAALTVAVVAPAGGVAAASEYVALSSPRRLVDTRPGGVTFDGRDAGVGLRPAGSTMVVQVADRAGVPADASSVVLNVTAVAPLGPGHLTVHPTGTSRPNASNVNYYPAHTTANTVIARVGTDGSVSVYTFAATHLVVDIAGRLPTDTYHALAVPLRLADTRPGAATTDGQQAGTGLVPSGGSLQLHVAGRAGVPSDASSVVLNVTAVAPLGPGHVTVHPTGTPRPNASNVNYYPAHTTANTVIARLGAGGDICAFTHTTTHFVIDIAGYLTGPPPPPTGPTCPPGPLPTWGPPVERTGDDVSFARGFAASDLGIVAARPSSTDGPPASTTVSFSTDGEDWDHVADIDGVRFWAMVDGGPGFVAVGHEDTDDIGFPTSAGVFPLPVPAVWTSADGKTWVPSTIGAAPFEYGRVDSVAVTASGGFVAGGSAWNGSGAAIFGQMRPVIWTSPDGLTWTLRGDPFGPVPEYVRTTVAAGAGGIVVIVYPFPDEGSTGPVSAWWSPDGATWTEAPSIDSFGMDRAWPRGVVAFGSGFVMIGEDWQDSGIPYVWTSPDGRMWNSPTPLPIQPQNHSASLSLFHNLSTDGTVLVATGMEFAPGPGPASAGAAMWMSIDASNWVLVPAAALDAPGSIESRSAGPALPFEGGWIALGHGSIGGVDVDLIWRSI